MGCCCIKAYAEDTYEPAQLGPAERPAERPGQRPEQRDERPESMPIFGDRECLICLDENEVNGWEWTPCSHGFHSKCLRDWLCVRPVCPMCSQPVFSPKPLRKREIEIEV